MATETNTGLTYQEAGSLQTDILQNAELNLFGPAIAGTVTRNFASDANITLIAAEYWTSVLILTDTGVVLTTGRDVVFPVHFPMMLVVNSTAQTLTLKKSGQTGITVAAGQSATIASGAADVVQASSSGGGGGGSAVSALSIASGVVDIDCSLGDYFTLAMTANVTSVTFSSLPAAGTAQTIMIQITQDGTGNRTMTMPSSFDWASGTVGVLSTAANAVDVLALTTFNQGTTWIATLSKGHA